LRCISPQLSRVQRDDHLPGPANYTISDTSQEVVNLLGHLGTLLAHVQPAVTQNLFLLATFQTLCPKTVAMHGVVVAKVQDSALSPVEAHTIGPFIHRIQIPL